MDAKILYYPFIEFHNEDWVKRALLYWDKVLRIVPDGYCPKDSSLIRELKDAGLIKDITAKEENLRDAQNEFTKRFRDTWLVRKIEECKNDPQSRLHISKVSSALLEKLRGLGIDMGDGPWARVPKEIGGFYMMTLANAIAKRRRIVTGTDIEECWAINPVFSKPGGYDEFRYNENSEGTYAQLFLLDVFPSNLNAINSDNLISLCRDRKDEKKLLRDKMEEFMVRVRNVTDREELEDEASEFLNEIEEAKEEYKRSQESSIKERFNSALGVLVPISTNLLDPTINPIKVGADILIEGYSSFRKLKPSKTLAKSYQSYLVGVDRLVMGNITSMSRGCISEFVSKNGIFI
ncbi:MAG: hypothetical protein LUD17_16525 [Bacteroidales bacterium]|nr:hypothetical protein [Bacteroidales bacterium]